MLCTLWCLALAKKSCNNINNSRAQVSNYIFSCDYVLNEDIDSCGTFNQAFLDVLYKYAPLKKKLLKAHHASMYLSLCEKVLLGKGKEKKMSKKQKNCRRRLYKKDHKKFFHKLNSSFVKSNKLFRKTVKPSFSNNWNCRININYWNKIM